MRIFAVVALGRHAVLQAAARWVLRVRCELRRGNEAHVARIIAAEATAGAGRRCPIASVVATPLPAVAARPVIGILARGLACVVEARAVRDMLNGIDALEPVVVRAGDRVGRDAGEADEQGEKTHFGDAEADPEKERGSRRISSLTGAAVRLNFNPSPPQI